MEDERSTFKFFRSFYDAALDLYQMDKASAADFLMALCEYALNGTEPETLSGVPAAMFKLVKPNLDASKKRSAAGAKGGNANIEANRSTALANLKQNRIYPEAGSEAQSEALPKQTPKQDRSTPEAHSEAMKEVGSRKKEVGSKEDRKNDSYIPPYSPPKGTRSEDFEAFWAAYPRKVGKQAALKAYERNVDVPVETLLSVIGREKRSEQWRRDGGQFIPHPATWLNQHRWLDEPTETNDFAHRDKSGDLDLIENYLHRRDADGTV